MLSAIFLTTKDFQSPGSVLLKLVSVFQYFLPFFLIDVCQQSFMFAEHSSQELVLG